jgi:uncharacterized protein DUF3108
MRTLQKAERRSQVYGIIAAFLAVLLFARLSPAGDNSGGSSRVVFPVGETLVYEVHWSPPVWMFFLPSISAGEITFTFQGHTDYKGKPAFKIRADAVSSGFLSSIAGITVADSFESIVSARDFCSLQMRKKIREGKRQRDILLTFDSSKGTGQYLAYDVSLQPPVELKNEPVQNVPDCVQDLLSAIYYTRLQDLKVGNQIPLAVSDNGKVKKIEIKVQKREMVDTPNGQLLALRTEAISVFGGLFRSGGTLLVWVSDDERRLPLRFEAKVKLGKVFGTIRKVSSADKEPNGMPE